MKIDKGVPIPSVSRRYPWGAMEDGDSIFLADVRSSTCSARNAAASWLKIHRPGWRVVGRIENGGLRLWFTSTPK